MNEQEEDESQRDKKVDRACRLSAAQQSDGRRNCGIKTGRHRQACPNFQREQNEDHEQIGEPLEHVVGASIGLTGPRKAQMMTLYIRDAPP